MSNMGNTDTIAAVATAMSPAGIGIIRVSGEDAIEIVDQIFKSKKKNFHLREAASHTAHYGWIQDGDEILDEVLVLIMKSPHSYTREDTAEINCHGGVLMMKRILETVIRYGARPAEPGEFTKRAFLNGRIDLSQAEAVMDVIQAQNDYAMKSSVSQLSGSVSRKIRRLREKLIYQIAYIESALDDPEHISLDGYGNILLSEIKPMIEEVEKLILSADQGKILSEGVKTVILGKPNAGKSSLMNVLLGEERAIVTDVEGTTRDTLEEKIRLKGINLNIVDTAGIRETDDIVEKIGVSRAKNMADDADLIIYVVDGSRSLDHNDDLIIDFIKGKKALVLINKTDLDLAVSKEEMEKKTGLPVILISAKEETGIDEMGSVIQEMFYGGEIRFNDQVMITNVRHKSALINTLSSLKMAESGIDHQMPEDLLTIDLMEAYEQLGIIIGESVEDDLVNEIFSKFCMGK